MEFLTFTKRWSVLGMMVLLVGVGTLFLWIRWEQQRLDYLERSQPEISKLQGFEQRRFELGQWELFVQVIAGFAVVLGTIPTVLRYLRTEPTEGDN